MIDDIIVNLKAQAEYIQQSLDNANHARTYILQAKKGMYTERELEEKFDLHKHPNNADIKHYLVNLSIFVNSKEFKQRVDTIKDYTQKIVIYKNNLCKYFLVDINQIDNFLIQEFEIRPYRTFNELEVYYKKVKQLYELYKPENKLDELYSKIQKLPNIIEKPDCFIYNNKTFHKVNSVNVNEYIKQFKELQAIFNEHPYKTIKIIINDQPIIMKEINEDVLDMFLKEFYKFLKE